MTKLDVGRRLVSGLLMRLLRAAKPMLSLFEPGWFSFGNALTCRYDQT
jgi:hypothetical protein